MCLYEIVLSRSYINLPNERLHLNIGHVDVEGMLALRFMCVLFG